MDGQHTVTANNIDAQNKCKCDIADKDVDYSEVIGKGPEKMTISSFFQSDWC